MPILTQHGIILQHSFPDLKKKKEKKLRGICAGYILKLDLGQLDFAIYFTQEGGNNQSKKIAYSSDRIVVSGHLVSAGCKQELFKIREKHKLEFLSVD